MKKKILMIGALLITMAAGAAPLSPQQSLTRALSGNNAATQRMAHSATEYSLAYTASCESQPTFYIFQAEKGGYIITGADDIAAPVLAYIDSGVFDQTDMPPQMQWWLSQYSEEIAAACKVSEAPVPGAEVPYNTSADRKKIAPMVNARYNQSEPYNLMCPTINGNTTVTGCSATAMAQIMRYFKYPTTGTGSISYSWAGGSGETLSMDFSATTFDWNNILNIYTSSATTEQKNAVALLMKACGYAQNMNYGVSASSASTSAPAPAFIKYFNYSQSIKSFSRSIFGLNEWIDMLYNNLAGGSPVFYTGQSSGGGHAFVCDGYDVGDYFHFNWGWGGKSDGYFRVTALNPSSLGIGGGTGGYNYRQTAIFNIKPAGENDIFSPMMFNRDGATMTYSSGSFNFSGGFYNGSSKEISIYMGVELEDQNGAKTYLQRSTSSTFQPNYGYNSYSVSVDPSKYNGTYKVRPAFLYKPDNSSEQNIWYPISLPYSQQQYWVVTFSDGNATVAAHPTKTNLQADNLALQTDLYPGLNFKLTADITNPNTTEIVQEVSVGIYKDGSLNETCETNPIDIIAGSKENFTFQGQFPSAIAAGNYSLALVVESGSSFVKISDPIDVTVNAKPTSNAISCPSFVIANSANVDCKNVQITMTLKCTEGTFANPIYVFLMDSEGNQIVYFTTPPVFLRNGESKVVEYSFPFDYGELGKEYRILLNYPNISGSLRYLAQARFTVGTTEVTAINADNTAAPVINPNPANDNTVITASAPIENIEVYNMQGAHCGIASVIDGNTAHLDVSTLPSGIYLARVQTTDGTVSTIRLIKK